MKTLVLFFFLCLSATPAAWEKYPGSTNEILQSDPVAAAKRAVEAGEFRLILVADCFMGMPGFTGGRPPELEPLVAGATCEEMFGQGEAGNAGALKEWVRSYNTYILQHNTSVEQTR